MGGYIAAVAVDLIVLLNSRFNSMGMRNLMWIEMLFLFFYDISMSLLAVCIKYFLVLSILILWLQERKIES
jgi:hypothetical protein